MRASFYTTSNSRQYKLMRRKYIASIEGLCSYCGLHRGENARGKYYYKWKVKKAYQLDAKRRHRIGR